MTMPLELKTIPCLQDNYAYLIHNPQTKETALIDAPEAAPINAVLAENDWRLTDVFLTHHHWDHVDALGDINGVSNARIIGAKADAHRLPDLDLAVSEGDPLTLCGEEAQIFDVSGHTIGHLALYLPQSAYIFTADSLMAMGCGRLFEGSPEMMLKSMEKLKKLPPETLVCSGHEYTTTNLNWALTVEPNNANLVNRAAETKALRAENKPSVPSLLSEELATNPFLRCDSPDIRTTLGMENADDLAVFTELRERRNNV